MNTLRDAVKNLSGTVLEIGNISSFNVLQSALRNGLVKFFTTDVPDEGIKLAEMKQPDVIFIDPFMPVSGFKIYEILQLNQKTKHMPVIFYTDGNSEVQKILKELGVPYICKPFDREEMANYLLTYLNS